MSDGWHHQGGLALGQCCLQAYEGLVVGPDRVLGTLFVCPSKYTLMHTSLFGAPLYEGLFSSLDGVANVMSVL